MPESADADWRWDNIDSWLRKLALDGAIARVGGPPASAAGGVLSAAAVAATISSEPVARRKAMSASPE